MNTRHLISAVCGTILKVAVTVVVVMLLYKGAIMAYDYGYRVFAEPPVAAGEGRAVTVTVTEKMTSSEMGEMLFSKGLIRDAKLFEVQFLLSEFRSDVKPGTYDLSTSMTVEEMLEVMARPVEDGEVGKEGSAVPGSNSQSNTTGDESDSGLDNSEEDPDTGNGDDGNSAAE